MNQFLLPARFQHSDPRGKRLEGWEGLKLKALAQEMGWCRQHLANVLTRQASTTPTAIAALAGLLEVGEKELVDRIQEVGENYGYGSVTLKHSDIKPVKPAYRSHRNLRAKVMELAGKPDPGFTQEEMELVMAVLEESLLAEAQHVRKKWEQRFKIGKAGLGTQGGKVFDEAGKVIYRARKGGVIWKREVAARVLKGLKPGDVLEEGELKRRVDKAVEEVRAAWSKDLAVRK